ncbi:hypothetical protein MAPG_01402 [Magnaporthiopsis poae ATCC 64411]|uniref:FAD/NAD(P)-binding domain-containing protein n=1 Tax=Magnaporthiopsis poae (strain ATCC 64411 / 73-15) TaxID=644358 RepID=A0A0C4DNL0_MAGP6|nr:hypothetical protein MAPG_01402 [Magnaporthiopsis poae ATCC 64411]
MPHATEPSVLPVPTDLGQTQPVSHPFVFRSLSTAYKLGRKVVNNYLTPDPKDYQDVVGGPRIAVIGAGITGVTAAAYLLGYGFNVVIFEKNPRANMGGIWTKVRSDSQLRSHTIMFRFFPKSQGWNNGELPSRQQILDQITELWTRYRLNGRTRFETEVDSIAPVPQTNSQANGPLGQRWYINDDGNGAFDAVIIAAGVCGSPKCTGLPSEATYNGVVRHFGEVQGHELNNKRVVIFGHGAATVDAYELAQDANARSVHIAGNDEPATVPRNSIIQLLEKINAWTKSNLAAYTARFGAATTQSLLKLLYYRDVDQALGQPGAQRFWHRETVVTHADSDGSLMANQSHWIKCIGGEFRSWGILAKQEGQGQSIATTSLMADIVILALGYTRPRMDFIPQECKTLGSDEWFAHAFAPTERSICVINCMPGNVGEAGWWTIGLTTRMLVMFLTDPSMRPGLAQTRASQAKNRLADASLPLPPMVPPPESRGHVELIGRGEAREAGHAGWVEGLARPPWHLRRAPSGPSQLARPVGWPRAAACGPKQQQHQQQSRSSRSSSSNNNSSRSRAAAAEAEHGPQQDGRREGV